MFPFSLDHYFKLPWYKREVTTNAYMTVSQKYLLEQNRNEMDKQP